MDNFDSKIERLKGPIFIFGASGFIGVNLLITILKKRKDCFAITHDVGLAWRFKMLEIPEQNILHCDINHKKSVEELFDKYQPKTIFDLSGYGGYSKQDNINLIFETNVSGTLNILQSCTNIDAYIHAGSSSEYGLNSSSPNEESALIPNSHYAVSKVCAGYLIAYYARFYNLPCLNLRLYSIYGPWEEPDRLMPKMVEYGVQNKFPDLADPSTTRDFVYIDDCVEAFIFAATSINPKISGQSVNIGTGNKTTLQELADSCKKIFKIDKDPTFDPKYNRRWDTEDWYGNYEKAEKLIGWKPINTLEEGLVKFADWQKKMNYDSEILSAFYSQKRIAKISAVIASYKDGQAIPFMYKRLVDTFNKIGCDYEIIFVNDNSPDNSQEILEEICLSDLNVIAIKHSRNFGSQAAFISGMEIASGDAVVIMDGDLQDPPELIQSFYEQWQNGYQVVYGNRTKREVSLLMNFAYTTFYKIFSRLSNIHVPQNAGDFSLMDQKVVEHIVALPEKEQFVRGLRAWVGFKQTGVDYIRPERMFGKSTNNLHKNIGWAKKGILSFSYLPLEILSYGGIILTFISFLAIIYQITFKYFYPDIPHGVPTIIVLILFFGGIQLLAIALIGEYLSKVVDETKSRPKFIRDKVIIKGRSIEKNSELNDLINRKNETLQ